MNKLNIISFNANGLSAHHKFSLLLSKISHIHASIILIQEFFTNSSQFPDEFRISLFKSLWPGSFFYSKHLITLISPSFTASHIFTSNDQRIMDIKVSSKSSSFIVRNIYAPAEAQSNRLFWQNLPPITSSYPQIVGGDFNTTVHLRDRISSSSTLTSPNINLLPSLFPNLIDFAGSLPGPPKFTFFRNSINYVSRSRIDFILLSPSFISPSSSSYTISLSSLSDHRALIFKSSTTLPRPQWRMNTSLLSIPYVKNNISSILSSYTPPSSPSNWDDCKNDIKNFMSSISTSCAKKTNSSIKNLTNRIYKLENSKNPDITLISHLKNILSKLEHNKLTSLAIRSKIKWYEQGEKPTSYFYNRFKYRQSNMNIDELFINPPNTSNSQVPSNNTHQILDYAQSHFSSLWSNPPPLPPSSPLFSYIPKLPPSSISSLDSPISPQELYDTIKSKEDHSSPGPDGIPYKFYKLFPTLITNILLPIFNMITNGSPPPSS